MRYLVYLLIIFLFAAGCQSLRKDTVAPQIPLIKVLLSSQSEPDSLIFSGIYEMQSEEAVYEFGRSNNSVQIQHRDNQYIVFNKNRRFIFQPGQSTIFRTRDASASFKFGGQRYPGDILLLFTAEAKTRFINQVDLEQYIQGVVPAELPSSKMSYLEALKAQAICARTYAMGRLDQTAGAEFNVYASVRDQAYAGLDRQTTFSRQAVIESFGTVLMFSEKPAVIYYHASSGGLLENGSVFGSASSTVYLKEGKDQLGSKLLGAAYPKFRWSQSFSLPDLDKRFREMFRKSRLSKPVADTAQVEMAFKIMERSPGLRVSRLSISYADTSVILKDYEIRRFFTSAEGTLPSNLFSMDIQGDSLLVLNGGGFGHGVGMSQWGAVDMSEQGFKHYHILKKYFPDTYLKKVY